MEPRTLREKRKVTGSTGNTERVAKVLRREGAFDAVAGFGGKAGRGACTLLSQAVRVTMERVVNEENLIVVATTEDTHHEMHTQSHALQKRQIPVERRGYQTSYFLTREEKLGHYFYHELFHWLLSEK